VHETGTAAEAGSKRTGLLRDSTIEGEFCSNTDRRILEHPSGREDRSPTRGAAPSCHLLYNLLPDKTISYLSYMMCCIKKWRVQAHHT
jgi:hypothetical protein